MILDHLAYSCPLTPKKGASKLALSTISSEELWQSSGRLEKGLSELFRFEDRKDFVLGEITQATAIEALSNKYDVLAPLMLC
ncbi:hypothetical protein HOY80DRAFT_879784 [Tuber brumale]|nr:hypothetical protein HOY80DRAFT_879784 [Tuber brumale]